MPVTSRLLAIELNGDFIPQLQAIPDPRLTVHHGSAEDLPEILEQHGLDSADIIYSGIPFSIIPAPIGKVILERAWSCLNPGGRFVAYQLRSRVKRLARDLMGSPDVEFELLNFPPLWVYRWLKQPPEDGELADACSGQKLASA
jgi:phospholipid N-methyltransferase